MKNYLFLGVLLMFGLLINSGCTKKSPEFIMVQKIVKDLQENSNDYELNKIPNVDLTLKNKKKKNIIYYYKPLFSTNGTTKKLGAIYITVIKSPVESVEFDSETDEFSILEEQLKKFKSRKPFLIKEIDSIFESHLKDSITKSN